jgi:hypothetical protein
MTFEEIWRWFGGKDLISLFLRQKQFKNNTLFTDTNQGAFIPIAFFHFPYSNVFSISPFI